MVGERCRWLKLVDKRDEKDNFSFPFVLCFLYVFFPLNFQHTLSIYLSCCISIFIFYFSLQW